MANENTRSALDGVWPEGEKGKARQRYEWGRRHELMLTFSDRLQVIADPHRMKSDDPDTDYPELSSEKFSTQNIGGTRLIMPV